MKIWTMVLASVIAMVLSPNAATAQRPDKPAEGPGARRAGERPDRPQGARPRGPGPVIQALDADGNGEISAEEIENAVAALKKLDKNGDGKLTRDELRPPFRGPGGRGSSDRPERPKRPGNRGGPDGNRDRPERPERPAPAAER